MAIEIQSEITRDDFASFNKYYFMKRQLKRYIILAFVFSVLIMPFILADFQTPGLEEFLYSIVIFNLFFFGLAYFRLNRTKWFPMKDGSILGERKYTIQDNEIICEKEGSISKSNLNRIKSLDVGPTAIYLWVDTSMAFIIPKRSFASIESQNEFIDVVKSKIS